MTTFSDLGLAESLLRALRLQNYTIPTPIQAQSIPILLEGADLLGPLFLLLLTNYNKELLQKLHYFVLLMYSMFYKCYLSLQN